MGAEHSAHIDTNTVRALQEFLNSNGYKAGPNDGSWGDMSAHAFQRFLKHKGFYHGPIDGHFLQGHNHHVAIEACQHWLTSLGQDPGPCDGKFGKVTTGALKRALSEHGRYYDGADCEGIPAKERVEWLHNNEGLESTAAKERVMGEFPAIFRFIPGFMCGEHTASKRATWLMENEGMSLKDARLRVMNEFPRCDYWKADAMCGDKIAADRVAWLESQEGMSAGPAKERVMREFRFVFLHHA